MFVDLFIIDGSISFWRIFIALVSGGSNILQYWIFIEGYYFAEQAKVTEGAFMSLFSIYPVLIGFLFFIFFDQKLKKSEVIGIILCGISICLLSLSRVNT